MEVIRWLYEWILAPLGLYVLVHPVVRAVLGYYDYKRMLREAHALNPTYTYVGYKLIHFLAHTLSPIPEMRAPGYHWYSPGVWEVYEIKAGVQNEDAIRAWVEADNQTREKRSAAQWLRDRGRDLILRAIARARSYRKPKDD